ncbi:hypothetical protein BH09ACT7_BH09ACT7_45240 [soil metagenome]
MEQSNIPSPTPTDATKATADQQRLQEELDHKNDSPDPNPPGGHQSREQIADET